MTAPPLPIPFFSGGAADLVDPFAAETTLVVLAQGANGSAAGIGDNLLRHTVTITGSAVLSDTAAIDGFSTMIGFDGSSKYLSFPSSSDFDTDAAAGLTVEGFFRPTAAPGAGTVFQLLGRSVASPGERSYSVSLNENRQLLVAISSNSTSFDVASGTPGTVPLTLNVINHVAFVHDAVNDEFYAWVDGALAWSLSSASNPYVGATSPFLICASSTDWFEGQAGPFRVTRAPRYTSAFTPPTYLSFLASLVR